MGRPTEPAGTRLDLAWLLHPISLDDFFASYREKQPLHIAGRAPDYYRDLFSLDDLDHALMNGKLAPGDLVVSNQGKTVPAGEIIQQDGSAALNRLYDYYRQGHTIYLYNLDRRNDAVRRTCRNVEALLHHRTYPAVFLSPPRAVGLPAHFDVPEIFVFQLHGQKTWRLYEPVVAKPFQNAEQVPVTPEQIGEPIFEATLEAGDLLYFPRGYVHEPFTSEASSLHITLGLTVRVWWDVFEKGLQQMMTGHPKFRDSLPRGYLTTAATADMKEQFRSLLHELVESIDLEQALQALREDFFLSRPPLPDGHFRQLQVLDRITADTVVMKREGAMCYAYGDLEHAGIVFSGGKLSGPASLEMTLQDIMEREGPFRVDDIETLLPINSKIVLIRNLVKAGFLKISSV